MAEQNLLIPQGSRTSSPTLRELVAIGFRHRRLILVSFLAILAGTLIYALGQPNQYQAEMKILVKRERMDPLVTPETNATPKASPGVSPEELNSEVLLLQSRDLLEKVAAATAVQPAVSWWERLFSTAIDQSGSEASSGVPSPASLDGILEAAPMKKSNLISVTYTSTDPQQAARVLNVLGDFYLEKHLAVHRPAGAFEFFKQETERYRGGLASIEARLSEFGQAEGVVSAELMKETTLKQFTDFEARLKETQAAIAESQERIRAHEAQLAATPPRMISNVRTSENRQAIEHLKSTLVTLELKRTELLGKYEPTYRTVQEVDKQIAQVRTSLAAEEKVIIRDETTDRNPVHEMLKAELVKAKSELPALQARARTLTHALSEYRQEAHRLDQKGLMEHDLLRAQKMAEENYQLYVRKQEEARISNALDKQRIVNVAIVEQAAVPVEPSGPRRSLIVLAGGVLASLLSVGLAFVSDRMSLSFRNPQELEAFLGIPVLAAMTKREK